MANYCPICRFVYPDSTEICFSCGRHTVSDNSSIDTLLQNGYQGIDLPLSNIATTTTDNEGSSETSDLLISDSKMESSDTGSTNIIHPELSPDLQHVTLHTEDNNRSDASNHQVTRSPSSVLTGGNVEPNSPNNSSVNRQVSARNDEYRQFIRRQRMQLTLQNTRVALSRLYEWFISLPWALIFRILLIFGFIAILVFLWNNRYAAARALFSFLSKLISFIIELIIPFLPILLLIYLVFSLFRGHF